jgi:hypothetical protein
MASSPKPLKGRSKSAPSGPSAVHVAIIASGKDYQEAAAWAAPTYTRQVVRPDYVSVLLPRRERPSALLKTHAQKFGFKIRQFPFRPVGEAKFTSQLKCQAFCFALSESRNGEILFLVDADTYCVKPLTLSSDIQSAILGGKIGLAPDIEDRHFRAPTAPWYLNPEERTTYVNSGVILASRASLDMFKTFRKLSRQPPFLHGPFNDQKVINFSLGKHFRNRLLLLSEIYNAINNRTSSATIIGHCPGGAGRLGSHPRKQVHLGICAGLLNSNGLRARFPSSR